MLAASRRPRVFLRTAGQLATRTTGSASAYQPSSQRACQLAGFYSARTHGQRRIPYLGRSLLLLWSLVGPDVVPQAETGPDIGHECRTPGRTRPLENALQRRES